MRFSLQSIAEKAQVSTTTVFRTLKNKPNVHPSTRERIISIVKQEFPEREFRSFNDITTKQVGVIVIDVANSYFSNIAKKIEETLEKKGFTMLLADSGHKKEKEFALVEMFCQMEVSGILLAAISPDKKTIELLQKSGIPFSLINCMTEIPDVDWISSDNIRGGYIATEHLINLGHEKIMFIKGINDRAASDRYEGFKRALSTYKYALSEQTVIPYGASNEEDGYRTIMDFLKRYSIELLPSAIFTCNDSVAIGVMEGLIESGIMIPERVSVVGYDNISIAKFLKIPLTTIDQSEHYVGEIAAKQIIGKIKHDPDIVTKNIVIKPILKERESTCPYMPLS